MTERCPSDYAFEAYLLSGKRSPAVEHLEGCAVCQVRFARMQGEGRQFHDAVYPATRGAVLRARRRPAVEWFRPRSWMIVPALGFSVALLVLVLPHQEVEHLGLKGPKLEFFAFAHQSGEAKQLSDGAAVAVNAAIRFKVRLAEPCQLWIVSIDASHQISRLFPAAGSDSAPLSGTLAVPGGAILDGQSGPERLFAICSQRPLSFEEIAQRLRSSVPEGEAGVRQRSPIPGLPPGTQTATLLIEKRLGLQP